MAQPPVYNRNTSFANAQALAPTALYSGTALDTEFSSIKATLDAILNNLALLQNNDGTVANGSIGANQLSSSLSVGFTAPTSWATGTAYVSSPASTVFQGTAFYRCLVSHTASSSFTNDLNAGYWSKIVDLSSIPLVAANQISVTANGGNVATNVQTSLTNLDTNKAATSHTHTSSQISDSTSAGRALLTAANVGAQQTALGLGSLAYLNSIPVTAIGAQLAFTGVITPAAIASNTNDWAPTGLATAAIVRVSASSAINLTGLAAQSDGTIVMLDNTGTNPITMTAQDTSSAAANRFQFPRPYVLRPSQSIMLKYDAVLGAWRPVREASTNPIAAGYKNLICGNVSGNNFTYSGTANTDFTIQADALTLEDANGESWRVQNVNVTARISNTGANGFDGTGSNTSANLFVWVIGNPTTNTIAALVSRSATAPTMPSGYTFKARVSATFTNGSTQLLRTLQYGNRAHYVVSGSVTTALPIAASGTSVAMGTSLSLSGLVPTTAAAVRVILFCGMGAGAYAQVAPNSSYYTGGAYQTTPTAPPPISASINNGGTAVGTSVYGEIGLESMNLYWGCNSTGNSLVEVYGWVDNI